MVGRGKDKLRMSLLENHSFCHHPSNRSDTGFIQKENVTVSKGNVLLYLMKDH